MLTRFITYKNFTLGTHIRQRAARKKDVAALLNERSFSIMFGVQDGVRVGTSTQGLKEATSIQYK